MREKTAPPEIRDRECVLRRHREIEIPERDMDGVREVQGLCEREIALVLFPVFDDRGAGMQGSRDRVLCEVRALSTPFQDRPIRFCERRQC